jgi:hypothetical protein
MILGHLAIAGIAKRKFLAENSLFLLGASYGPDLVDKTLNLAFGAPGRGAGHSLVLFVLLAAAGWWFCQRSKITKQVFSLGIILWLSHLTTDLIELKTVLWPFFGRLPSAPSFTFLERLRNYYILHMYPVQLGLEILFLSIAMILWITYLVRRRLRSPS